jgi:uncharacterized membrane protein YhiD involved in acid resistance
MPTNLENAQFFSITGLEIVANILVALMCGLFIAWIYRISYRGPGYSIAFVNSLVFLTMITAVMILAIGSNLASAFGLVGAMSIIRFRTAVKDTQDIIYIFFVLAVGMASGGGFHKVAIMGTVSVGAMIYLLSRMGSFASKKEEYLLQISYGPNGNGDGTPAYVSVLQRYCRAHHVVNTRTMGSNGEALELSYYVKLRDKNKDSEFVHALRQATGVSRVSLYFDEEEF